MPELFIKKYPPRKPHLRPSQNTPSQIEKLTEKHGLHGLDEAPASWAALTNPSTYEKSADGHTRYLWVITNVLPQVRCINEHDTRALTEERSRVCHTNLTGGEEACAGGELWFRCPSTLYLNGRSGRYPVTDEEQLHDAAQVFARKGYRVGSMGVSPSTGMPRTAAREKEIEWIEPKAVEVHNG